MNFQPILHNAHVSEVKPLANFEIKSFERAISKTALCQCHYVHVRFVKLTKALLVNICNLAFINNHKKQICSCCLTKYALAELLPKAD